MRDETTQRIRSQFHRTLDGLGSPPELAAIAVFRLLRLRPSLRALCPWRFLALPPPSRLIAAGDGP